MSNRIYLDWNATAPLTDSVRTAMTEALAERPGNASSVHQEGQRARSVVERARRAVARAVNAPPQAVVFTSGATEANNQVLRMFDRVAASAVEHPSVREVNELLGGATVPVDGAGRVAVGDVVAAAAASDIVSVMLANNEIGNLYDVGLLAAEVHGAGALLHTDATQALGRVPVDFAALGVDFLTLSFHKCGGPKGIGAIVTREGLQVRQLLAGGHQERGRRPGTENVVAAAGVEALCRDIAADVPTSLLETKRGLFLEALAPVAPELRGDQELRLPNTVNAAFAGVDGEDLLLALDLEGVAASSGSACTAGSLEPSHVVLALGLGEREARRSVRFSFGATTSDEELLEAGRRIVTAVQRLQHLRR